LWFARKGFDSTSGFPAYELPIQNIAAKLGRERNFQFLSPLHIPNKFARSQRTGR